MKNINIAIDGPAAAGKSTIAKLVAKQLNMVYVDTGAMYRAITLAHLQNPNQAMATIIRDLDLKMVNDNGQRIILNGIDVSDRIRENDITENVSRVSSIDIVREKLVEIQQDMTKNKGVVMDGRDIGTTVIPDAEVKIYMIASVDERAERRLLDNQKRGIESSLDALKLDIERRDHLDMTRAISPLQKAEDAIEIDTTGMTIEDVTNEILAIVNEKQKG